MAYIGNAPAAGILSGDNIQDGTVGTNDLANSAVTTAKIADGGVHTAKIADNAVSAAKLHTTAVTDKLGYTPLGPTLSVPVDLNNQRLRDTTGSMKEYWNLTSGLDNYAAGTGALIIQTNIPHTGNMFSVKVVGYAYNSAIPWEIDIGAYYGENSIYQRSAYTLGSPFGPNIQLAKNTSSGKLAIILGSVSENYGTTISVERFIQSFSDMNSSYAEGWTISRVASLSAYSLVTTIPVFTAVSNRSIPTTSGITANASGPFGYGPYSNYYVLGWVQGTFSSGSTYAHLATNLWGGGSPTGNTQYIMGGFRITGYLYNNAWNVSELHQFHNWSGGLASYVRTINASDVGNLCYVGSNGYVYIRLRSEAYAMYNIDMYQHPMYGVQNILVTSTTYSNSATI